MICMASKTTTQVNLLKTWQHLEQNWQSKKCLPKQLKTVIKMMVYVSETDPFCDECMNATCPPNQQKGV